MKYRLKVISKMMADRAMLEVEEEAKLKAINDKDGEEVDEKDRDLNKSNDEDKEGVSLDDEHTDSGTNDASFKPRRRHRRTRIKRLP